MKKWIALFLALICMCTLGACKNKTDLENGQAAGISVHSGLRGDSVLVNDAAEDTWGVTMTAEDATSTGLTLKISHSGQVPGGQLQTGTPYWLEVWIDGVWNPVPELPVEDGADRAWTMVAYLIPGNGSFEQEVHFEWIYGELPAGRYRIGKEIMLFRGTGDYDEQTYYAEFELK